MSEKIGKLIASRLKAKEKGQAWLAEEIGVSINAVSKWTKTGKIARERVPQVAALLDLSVDELLSGEIRAPVALELVQLPMQLQWVAPDEAEILSLFRASGMEARGTILSIARSLPKVAVDDSVRGNKPQ